MAILNETSIIYVDDSLSIDSRYPIVAECWCEDDSDLPTRTQFNKYVLCTGSKALTPNKTFVLSNATWVEKEESPFKDVYTKSEVDNLIAPLDSELTTLSTQVETLSDYTFKLVGISSLNKLDSSVWSGATTSGNGYIANNLPITLAAGSYIWKMKRDGNSTTSFVVRDADNNELYRVTRGAGVNDITQSFTISADAAFVSIYAGYNINYHDNMIFESESTQTRLLSFAAAPEEEEIENEEMR